MIVLMRKNLCLFIVLGCIVLTLFICNISVGDSFVSWHQIVDVLNGTETDMVIKNIVLSIRMPRAVVAVLIGMALSVSGLQMQTVFCNPLADPYLLGVSSGASFGVALFILGIPLLGWSFSEFWHSVGIVGAGWMGASIVLFCVILIGRRVKNIFGILILGVMLGYVIGAVIQIMQYLSSAELLKLFFLWSMGTMGNITNEQLIVMIPLLSIGMILSVASIKSLNMLLLGEEYAQTMGLDIKRSRTVIFLSVSLLAGTVTAFCGPIGFLGLAVPHLARLLFGNANIRILLPGSALIGAGALLVCDMVAKMLLLPVNCITALLGIPVIIWIICKNMRLI